jgi:hypothetical protein
MAGLRTEKKNCVIQEFLTLIKSNVNYETNYLYSEAGKKAFVSGKRAGDIVRAYYKTVIDANPDMLLFMEDIDLDPVLKKRDDVVLLFAEKFSLVPREARHIIRQIKAMEV